jgi:hypothetical protein
MAINLKNVAKIKDLSVTDLVKSMSKKQKAALGIGATGTGGVAGMAMKAGEDLVDSAVSNVQTAMDSIQQAVGIDVPKSLGDLAGQIVKLRVGLDDLSKDVGRATGLFTQLGGQLEDVAQRNRDLGATFERTSKAMIGLDQGFSLLARSSKQQRRETLRFTLALENLGVAAEDSGKGLEVFARGTAMSQEAARKSTERLIQLGRQIAYKGGPAQMMKDIAEIGPMIAKFGSGTEQVLGGLAKQARETGLSMREIFDVSDQFDTFDSAMEKAGQLNAQFGLGLSGTALMRADDEERKRMIVDSFQAQYGSFEGLGDRRQKQFMAEALGFGKDVAKARQYFEGEALGVDQVESLETAAKAQTKVSEIGAAAQEKALTAMGDTPLDMLGLNFGRVNQIADGLVLTFNNLNTSVQTYNRMTAAQMLPTEELRRAAQLTIMTNAGRQGAASRRAAGSMPGQPGLPGQPGGGDDLFGPGFAGTAAGAGSLALGGAALAGGSFINPASGLPEGVTAKQFKKFQNMTPKELDNLVLGEMSGRKPLPGGGFGRIAPDSVPAGAKAVREMGEEAAEAAAKQLTRKSTLKAVAKGAGKITLGLADLAFAYGEAEESIAAGKDSTEAYTREGLGAAGGILGGFGTGAAIGAMFGGPTPAAVVTGLIGGIGGAIIGEKGVEAAFDYFMGSDKGKREAATVKSKNQSADQALKKQQDSQRQAVASAGTAGRAFSPTTNVYLGEDLIYSSTNTIENALEQEGRRLPKKVPRGQVSSNTVIG